MNNCESTSLLSGNSSPSSSSSSESSASSSPSSSPLQLQVNTTSQPASPSSLSLQQPLPLTISNSSHCTTPISSPQQSETCEQNDGNESNDDESISGINLSMNKSNSNSHGNSNTNNKNNVDANSILNLQNQNTSKRPSLNHNHFMNMNMLSPSPSHLASSSSFDTNSRNNSHKMKIPTDFSCSSSPSQQQKLQRKSKLFHQQQHQNLKLFDNNNNNVPLMNMNTNDLTQLLLEYRQVLLDVLIKSMKMYDDNNNTEEISNYNNDNNNNDTSTLHKGIVLPVKCHCGFTSELSKQITRTSTYVHQLELKFRAFIENMKASTALQSSSATANESNRYTPKRPWFIDSSMLTSSLPLVGNVVGGSATINPSKMSLLDKKISRMSANDKPISLFSGNNSINSSLNGEDDDDDGDDDEDDDIDSDGGGAHINMNINNDDENFNNNNNHLMYTNGNNNSIVDEIIGNGGKTILEGYLKKMNELTKIHSEGCSDDDNDDDNQNHFMNNNMNHHIQQPIDDDEPESIIAEEDFHRGPGKRIDLRTKKLVVQMNMRGASYTDISRQIGISRKSVRRIISHYKTFGLLEKKKETRTTRKSEVPINGLNPSMIANNGGINMTNLLNGGRIPDSFNDGANDDDIDDEREMIVDDNVIGSSGVGGSNAGDDDDQDSDVDDNNHHVNHVQNEMAMKKQEIDANFLNQLSLLQKAMQASQLQQQQQQQQQQLQFNRSSKKSLSLIQQVPYNNNNNNFTKQSGANGSLNNNNHNRLSLIKQPERFKPYDLKVRPQNNINNNNNGSNSESLAQQLHSNTHRISKSHPIVPPLPQSTNSFSNNNNNNNNNISNNVQQSQQQRSTHQNLNKIYNNNNNHLTNNLNSTNNDNDPFERDAENSLIKNPKNKSNRQPSIDMSFKDSLIVPEADKNNNTTMNNCNLPVTSTTKPTTLSSLTNQPIDLANIQNLQIPASLVDGSTDSDTNLVPKTFVDGQFPPGIMNSLNPNRATKLTLEDFNIVWHLRSQHWTHNQIRKYFQQRGKSISKSSISRIMNGKQRNFQQFFNVVPASNANY